MHGLGTGLLPMIALRTAIVLVVLAWGVRIFGKRHIGELNLDDLMLVLVMANAVQNAMTRGNGRLVVALVSSGTLMLLGWLVTTVIVHRPSLETRLMGAPIVIVQDGRLLWKDLRREEIGEDDVMMAAREMGLTDLADVKLAVLEMDGSISVVPKEHS
jgi:uncharacterized membrane protein YcaP (DUF421 family)